MNGGKVSRQEFALVANSDDRVTLPTVREP